MIKVIITAFINRETKDVYKKIGNTDSYAHVNKSEPGQHHIKGALYHICMANPKLDIHKVKVCYPAPLFQKGA